MVKKIILLFLVHILILMLLNSLMSFADDQPDNTTLDFGYSDYQICENIPDFAKKISLLEPFSRTGPEIDPAPSDADDLFAYKYSWNVDRIRSKYRERLNEVLRSAPIVLVVDPDTDRQIQYKKTNGENEGFTLTSASVKRVLRNNTSVDISIDDNVWLKEAYWVNGRWMDYKDYANELFELYGEEAEKLIEKELLEENARLFTGSFHSDHNKLESPLYKGDTLIFVNVDTEASKETVFIVNDLFKFKTTDPLLYDYQWYDYQRMIGELIGDEALAYFDLEANPYFSYKPSKYLVGSDFEPIVSGETTLPKDQNQEFKKATMWILPACIGFVVGTASVFIPVICVTAAKKKKAKKALGSASEGEN